MTNARELQALHVALLTDPEASVVNLMRFGRTPEIREIAREAAKARGIAVVAAARKGN